jgi:hypothetical protein
MAGRFVNQSALYSTHSNLNVLKKYWLLDWSFGRIIARRQGQ